MYLETNVTFARNEKRRFGRSFRLFFFHWVRSDGPNSREELVFICSRTNFELSMRYRISCRSHSYRPQALTPTHRVCCINELNWSLFVKKSHFLFITMMKKDEATGKKQKHTHTEFILTMEASHLAAFQFGCSIRWIFLILSFFRLVLSSAQCALRINDFNTLVQTFSLRVNLFVVICAIFLSRPRYIHREWSNL